MRTRLQFLAGLFGLAGLAKAQDIGSAGTGHCVGEANGDGTLSRCKPKNGQCPVCGTMAERYEPEYRLKDCLPAGGNTVSCTHEPQPGERIVRCKRCSNAFWQDAEGQG